MNQINKACIVIACLIALAFLCFTIKWISADEPYLDNSGCKMTKDDLSNQPFGQVNHTPLICYDVKIYAQNEKIIKQNEQMIKLSAIASCDNFNTRLYINDLEISTNDLTKCIDKLVNITR